MQNILIADRSVDFCKLLAEKLKDSFCVKTCTDGKTALELFRYETPDLMVLDLEMPELDGLSILRALNGTGRCTSVIALTTCASSSYVQYALESLGVEYIFAKPCTAAAVASCVVDMLHFKNHMLRTPEEEMTGILIAMGLHSNMHGFPCLLEAIRIYSRDTTQQITKCIYPEVAKICGGTPERVERAIRGVIQNGWKNRNEAVWSAYFPGKRDDFHAPSNSVFIARMAMKIVSKKVG